MNSFVTATIKELLQKQHIVFENIVPLPASGGDRQYFLISTTSDSYIATYGTNIKENESFFYFTEIFKKIKAPVPNILAIDSSKQIYIQTFAGKKNLLEEVLQQGYTPQVFELYTKALVQLANLQVSGHALINYDHCYAVKVFDEQMAERDLNYFLEHFVQAHHIRYNKNVLDKEIKTLSLSVKNIEYKYFMYRDFQGRNIMLNSHNDITFIDYQGGMLGPLQYDVVSLLWQAKANLPQPWREALLENYYEVLVKQHSLNINREQFYEQYHTLSLLRILQVLGAYGLRGLKEKKQHFISSIYQGLKNVKTWQQLNNSLKAYPELYKIVEQITTPEFMEQYADKKLVVSINSFSFKQSIPADESGNGGGFVFDCRGILNPGRFEEYKRLTGRDEPVKLFLEEKTLMPAFLKSIFSIIDISVQDYLNRGFENLMINFGCTGGQHRSVYAADATAQYLREKYGVKTLVQHIEQEKKSWIN